MIVGLFFVGLSIEDRQISLAHSLNHMTKVYTHENFVLALEIVNRVKNFGVLGEYNIESRKNSIILQYIIYCYSLTIS